MSRMVDEQAENLLRHLAEMPARIGLVVGHECELLSAMLVAVHSRHCHPIASDLSNIAKQVERDFDFRDI